MERKRRRVGEQTVRGRKFNLFGEEKTVLIQLRKKKRKHKRKLGEVSRVAKVYRRPGVGVDMQGGCLCVIVCPICLALSLLTTPLASPPPPPPHTLFCVATASPHAGRRPGSFHPRQLVALFACTAHICAQLLACLRSERSRRMRASAGTGSARREGGGRGAKARSPPVHIRVLEFCL